MISIDYTDCYLDLHNCFSLETITEKDEDNSVELKFRKAGSDCLNYDELPGFKLKFKNVSEVLTKGHNPDYSMEYLEKDGRCPDLFGFSYAGIEIMDGPADHLKSNEALKTLLFTFVTGRSIKIMADSVELIVYHPEIQ